jgi:transposase
MEVFFMSKGRSSPVRYIGLDIHKHYLMAYGVDKDQNQVYGFKRVKNEDIPKWIKMDLTMDDVVVLEMTTNTWTMADLLKPHVHSVTVVHPPEVKAIVKARVMTDKKAARILAQLHAAKLLPAVWIPPVEVRELRALVAGRRKMLQMTVRAKNSLHSVLHRHQMNNVDSCDLFNPDRRAWWEELPVTPIEKVRILCDWDTLEFAKMQQDRYENMLRELAAEDARMSLLVQLPGISIITGMTVLGAIGVIERFPSPDKLVGYAGLGARVHSSGQSHYTGRITKSGRRDLRGAMVNAAHKSIKAHPKWKAEFERLEPRIGKSKAIVAVARKMLVAIWYILTDGVVDIHADPEQVARAFFTHAYKLGIENLPDGLSAREYVRFQLDNLGIGQELTHFMRSKKKINLPPSRLK